MNRTITFLLFCSLFLLPISYAFQFNSTGDFTVLQFTDFHYCEADDLDNQTQALQRRLIELVQPDLIILSGDAVSGYAGHYPGFFEQCWKKYTQPFVDAQIFYAYVHGNHDTEADLNGTQIVQLDKTNPYSVLRSADGIPDTTNYRIPVYSSQNQSHIATNIWMLDSGSVGCNGELDSWGCIQGAYLDWYDQESKLIKDQYGTNVHHVAFYHIPIPEYRVVYNDEPIYGQSNEIVSCPLVNTGFLSRILNNGDITGMFVGHDHTNDFAGWYQGVEFVYGRKSGYGSYGDLRGARIIKFKETSDGNGGTTVTRDHYVIQEDETIVTTKVTQVRQGAQETTCPVLPVSFAGNIKISAILAAVLLVVLF